MYQIALVWWIISQVHDQKGLTLALFLSEPYRPFLLLSPLAASTPLAESVLRLSDFSASIFAAIVALFLAKEPFSCAYLSPTSYRIKPSLYRSHTQQRC